MACDEAIDTTAYPELARQATDDSGNARNYSDLDIEDVPADKIVRLPYGDAGLVETMDVWGPEGCRYPYYGYLPDAPLCDECSSMYAAREAVLDGLWDGPCNDDDPLGCGCDCADFLRRDLSATCTATSCINVAQEYANVAQDYAPANSKCDGSDLKWDAVSGCTDVYDPNSQLTGSACLDATGAVPNATCYRTPAAISEPGFRWPPLDLCYPVHREAALGRRASVALALAIVVLV